jgi:O-antigen/teichoic acid export membrane protein
VSINAITRLLACLDSMTLANRTLKGILWNFAEQIGRRGINIVVTLLLARFLVPEDFGLVAVMSSVIAVAGGLMDSGLKQALIRMEHAVQVDYNTAFFSNLVLGLAAYAIIFAAAPTIAGFYGESSIGVLIRAGGIVILVNSFSVVQNAVFSKNLDFKALLMASVPASLISGVAAVVLAYLGYGVWALIGQMTLYALLSMIFLWRRSSWRPTFAASRRSFTEMFSFGSRLFAASTIDALSRNLYIFVIAKVFSTAIAGYYFFADKIKDLIISQLVNSIQTVTYPALSTMQNDDEKLKAGYRILVRITTFTLFPAMAFLAALAEPIFDVLLPANWQSAVPYLQLLCIAGMLIPLHSINLNILQVKGRSDLLLRMEIIKKTSLIIVLVISVQFGVFGVLFGRIVTSILGYITNSYFSSMLIDYPVREQLADFLPALFLSGIVGGLAYYSVVMLGLPAITELCVFGLLATVLYLTAAYTFKMEALKMVMQIVKMQGFCND